MARSVSTSSFSSYPAKSNRFAAELPQSAGEYLHWLLIGVLLILPAFFIN